MEGELRNFTTIGLTAVLSGCYCYALSKSTEKGALRLLLVLPVAAFFTAAPYTLVTCSLAAMTWFFLTWLGISKLLLFSFGTGPLALHHHLSLPHFVCTLLLPIKLSGSGSDPVKSNAGGLSMWVVFGAKAVGFGCFVKACSSYGEVQMPYWAMAGAYCCFIYLGLEFTLTIAGALARVLLGLQLAPQADKPYLASSLQNFWGRRWNLMVSDILRQTVYNPIRTLATPSIGKKWATRFAIFASFLVSGLMHEWIFTILIHAHPSWEIMWLFILHGTCVVIELVIKEAIGNKWKLHRVISGLLTLGFVIVTLAWLQLQTILRSNIHVKFIEEYAIFENFVKKNVMQLLEQVPLQ